MERVKIKILDHNLNGMAKFLAMLTQRGHKMNGMDDVLELYDSVIDSQPSEALMTLPHTTIKRMNYLTIAIEGLSTKAVSQLRTHATRLTFISTSTQYSSFQGREDNFVMPPGLTAAQQLRVREAYENIDAMYAALIHEGIDKDKASYLLPQGLRKVLIVSGNLDSWQYVMRTRLCHRNTVEVQQIMQQIYDAVKEECGAKFVTGCLPACVYGPCQEGKFCCGVPYEIRQR